MFLSKDYPLVSVIIPTHNRKDKVVRLVSSILSSDYPQDKIETIVVDDASSDGTAAFLKERFPGAKLKLISNSRNLLVAESRNKGIKASEGQFIFFIDDDTFVYKDTIAGLVKLLSSDPRKLIVGPAIYTLDRPDIVWSLGVKFSLTFAYGWFIGQGRKAPDSLPDVLFCDALPTAFMVKRVMLQETGVFDSELFPVAFEELDFCMRAKALGYQSAVLTGAKILHDRGKGDRFGSSVDFYYGTRNRFIAHALWSRNSFEALITKSCAFLLAILFIFLKLIIYPGNRLNCIKAILKGIADGLRSSRGLQSYSLRLHKGLSIDPGA